MSIYAWRGGNGNADDPSQWTPDGGPPQPGDVAFMANGTINLGGDDPLNGVPLYMPIRLTSQTLNVNGDDHLQFAAQADDKTTVNLADNSHWIGGFANGRGAQLSINATGSGEWDNGFSQFIGHATVNAPVGGLGGMIVFGNHDNATIEFKQGVGIGQVVGISGCASYGNSRGVVTVDDPSSYHATTVMGFGELILKNLSAQAWNLQNDTLSLLNQDGVVDQIHFGIGNVQGFGPQGLAVTQVGSDINIHTDGRAYSGGGVVLPQVG